MKTKLVSITPDAEKTISYIARVSNPNNQDNPDYAKLLKYCLKHGHYSVFEQAHMTVEIETTRAISAQILRHRSFTFQEFSQRYASVSSDGIETYKARRQDTKNRQNSIDDIDPAIQIEWLRRQEDNYRRSFEDYEWAVKNGVAKECARMVLPLQTKTKIYMTGSVRSFIHYLQVRTDPSTQLEHREVAESIKKIFIEQLPTVSEALDWK
jgi:thymidylate synthase (FAD)